MAHPGRHHQPGTRPQRDLTPPARSALECGSPLPLSVPAGRASGNATLRPRSEREFKAAAPVPPKRNPQRRTAAAPNPGGLPTPLGSQSVLDCGSPLPLSVSAGHPLKNATLRPRSERESKSGSTRPAEAEPAKADRCRSQIPTPLPVPPIPRRGARSDCRTGRAPAVRVPGAIRRPHRSSGTARRGSA